MERPFVSLGERAGRPSAAAAPSPAGSPRSGRAPGQRDTIPWSSTALNFLASSPLIIPVALIALSAFYSPRRCHMSLELTAEQQSPREGAEPCSWNLQWLQLCQGPKRCRQRQQRPGLRGEPCPLAPRRPLRCPEPRRPQPPPRAPLFANSAHMAGGRAPGTYIQVVEAAVHAQSHRTAPRSQAVAAAAAAPLTMTPLAAAPHTPRLFWRDAALYKVPAAPPPPGQQRLAPPRRCRRALGLRAGASGWSLSAAPGMGIALARRARGVHVPHGGICPPLIDVFIQAGF